MADDQRRDYRTDPPEFSGSYPNQGFDAALRDAIGETIARNVDSLLQVPLSILPDTPARHYLIHLARAGHECYTYHTSAPGKQRDDQRAPGQPVGTWSLWIEPLARISDGRDGRIPILLWLQTWQWLAPAIYCAIAHTSSRTSGPLGHSGL
jgi:hypothetical protein